MASYRLSQAGGDFSSEEPQKAWRPLTVRKGAATYAR